MTPSPMTPELGAWSTEMSGLHPLKPGLWLTMPQLPGETAKTAGSREAKSVTPGPTMSVTSGLKTRAAAEKCVIGLVDAEHDGAPAAALIDCSLNPRGVELLLVGGGE